MSTFDGQYEKFHTLKMKHCPIWVAPKNDLTTNECYDNNWKKYSLFEQFQFKTNYEHVMIP